MFASLGLRRLPRLGSLGAITALGCNELRVFQALANHSAKRLNESAFVIVFALIKPERLLITATEQMKRLNAYRCAFERAFQTRPEVFQSVSVNLTACVAFQMVNDLAVILLFEVIIGNERVRASWRACF